MEYKKVFIRFAMIILLILGIFAILLASVRIADKSWMATLGALGGPGAREQVWMLLAVGVIASITSLVVFFITFRKTKPLS